MTTSSRAKWRLCRRIPHARACQRFAAFAEGIDVLQRLGLENLDGIARTMTRHGIEADWDFRGMLYVATQPHQVSHLQDETQLLNQHGEAARMLDAAQARAELNSPTYLGACLRGTGKATVHPVKLAWGLRRAAESLGCASTNTVRYSAYTLTARR
jgi:glycine/D-amino acid oxidase-like deaminating enzyme